MRKLMNWGETQGDWSSAEATLPAMGASADPAVQRWCGVAGGLALILSRLSKTERTAHFSCTHALYEHVRTRLRQSQPVNAAPELLGEVMHEIAQVGDPLTRVWLRACFHASLRGEAAARQAATGSGAPATSALQSQPRPTLAFVASEADHVRTDFVPELLMERSAALRRRLAEARSTVFAE